MFTKKSLEQLNFSNHIYTTSDGQQVHVEHFGSDPVVLYVANLHGDEFRVGSRLRTALNRQIITDPAGFNHQVRIINAHPDAVRARTRTSPKRVNANREFPHPILQPDRKPIAPIARTLMTATQATDSYLLMCFFHGNEPDGNFDYQPFYMYDYPAIKTNPTQPLFDKLVHKLTDEISRDEVFKGRFPSGVFSGSDCELGNKITDGYIQQHADQTLDETIEVWAAASALIGSAFKQLHRTLAFEIPGYLEIREQQRMIDLILGEMVNPYLQYLKRN